MSAQEAIVPAVMIDAFAIERAHHEAGHAVIGLCAGWPFDHAELCPEHPEHAGQTVGPEADPGSAEDTVRHMQIAAAGPLAWQRLHRAFDERAWLLAQLRQAALDDPPNYVEPDYRMFAVLGQRLDVLAPAAETGPDRWASIWLAVQEQVKAELWPAIAAVARRLAAAGPQRLTRDEIADTAAPLMRERAR